MVEAGRCIELGAPCQYADCTSIATGVARLMAHVCQRSPKEYVSRFGKAFGIYASMLEDAGDYLDRQPMAGLPADEEGLIG